MKILKTLIILMTAMVGLSTQAQDQKGKNDKISVVVLNSAIKCNNCKARIEKNIPYEKGVKDLKVDIENKTVTITYRNDKNTAEKLCEAMNKLGYQSTISKIEN